MTKGSRVKVSLVSDKQFYVWRQLTLNRSLLCISSRGQIRPAIQSLELVAIEISGVCASIQSLGNLMKEWIWGIVTSSSFRIWLRIASLKAASGSCCTSKQREFSCQWCITGSHEFNSHADTRFYSKYPFSHSIHLVRTICLVTWGSSWASARFQLIISILMGTQGLIAIHSLSIDYFNSQVLTGRWNQVAWICLITEAFSDADVGLKRKNWPRIAPQSSQMRSRRWTNLHSLGTKWMLFNKQCQRQQASRTHLIVIIQYYNASSSKMEDKYAL